MSEFSYTIDDLKQACSKNNIKWSMHALKRLRERHITRQDFKNSIFTGEIIECYPEDCRTQSCLISGMSKSDKPLHNVSGYDEDFIYAITAYFPNPEEWENDFKTRRVNK